MLLPEKAPAVVGAKVSATLQLLPGLTDEHALVLAVKPLGRLASAAFQLNGVPKPSLCNVTFSVLLCPIVTLPKANVVTLHRLTAEFTVPLMSNDALLVAPAVVTAFALEPVVDVGMVIVIEHVAVGAMLLQVLFESVNRDDSPVRPVSVMAVLPSLRKLTVVLGAAAPYQTLPRLGGALVNVAVENAVSPLPLSAATRIPDAVSMATAPVRSVAAVGANRTVIVQVPLAARLAPQVVDTKLKSWPLTDVVVGGTITSGENIVLVSVALTVLFWPTGVVPNAGTVSGAAAPLADEIVLALGEEP